MLAAALALSRDGVAHAPHDVVSEVGISPDFANDRLLLAFVTMTDNNLLVRSTDAGRSWTYIGTPLANRLVDEVCFSPDWVNDGTVFAASPTQGAWRSTDRGLTWEKCSAGLTSNSVRSIAASPNYAVDGTLLAATGNGIFRSTDRGNTWAPWGSGLTEALPLRMRWVADAHGGSVAFVMRKTMHVSYDGGQNWTPTGTFAHLAESLAVSPNFAVDGTLAVSFGRFGAGVFLSTNGGLGFSASTVGLTDLFVNEVVIAEDGTMFCVTDTAGCFRAESMGGPWALFIDGFEEPSNLTTVHNVDVVVSPSFATDQTVFVGSYEGLYRSYNRGDQWRQLDIYSQRINRFFIFSPEFSQDRTVLMANYGGTVFRYREQVPPTAPTVQLPGSGGSGSPPGVWLGLPGSAATPNPTGSVGVPEVGRRRNVEWTPLGTSIATPWSSSFAASDQPLGQRMLLYGYFNLYKSFDEGQTWLNANKPAPISIVRALGFSPDLGNDGMVLMGSSSQGTYVSHDSATTWSVIAGLPSDLAASDIAFSPGFATDGTIFVSSHNRGIWKSTDDGVSWTKLTLPPNNIQNMVVSPAYPTDGTLLAAGFDSGMFRSTDGGLSWASAAVGLPAGEVLLAQSLVLSPEFATDGSAWVSMQNHGIWRSEDAGQSWQAVGSPPAPPMELAISPQFTRDSTLFVGTHGGTFVSRDAGQSWTELPPYARVDDRHPTAFYSWGWTTTSDPAGFTAITTTTTLAGAWTEYEGYGDRISWFGRTLPTGAIAHVSVDGGPPVAVDTWSATPASQVRLFERTWSEPGWHTLRVIHSGTANPASSGLNLHSDGFERLAP